jgi:hypothetical protein
MKAVAKPVSKEMSKFIAKSEIRVKKKLRVL